MANDNILDQSEIDALIRGIDSSDKKDLTAMEKDTLAEIGNISMGSAATALSTLINRKVTITVPDVSVASLADVQQSYPIPCIVVDVKYQTGLQGSNLLVIKEEDAAVIGALMMGLDESEFPDVVDEITMSALSEAMNVMMGSAATSMSELFNRLINISPPDAFRQNLGEDIDVLGAGDDMVAVISFRFYISDLVDSVMLQLIDLDFAKEMVASLFAAEESAEMDSAEVADPAPDIPVEPEVEPAGTLAWDSLIADEKQAIHDLGNLNIELIKDIPVKVRAILGRTKMSIENILKLGPGHIMELDTLDGEPIDVYANNTLIARGEVVVVGEQFGIRITEISTASNRIKSIS